MTCPLDPVQIVRWNPIEARKGVFLPRKRSTAEQIIHTSVRQKSFAFWERKLKVFPIWRSGSEIVRFPLTMFCACTPLDVEIGFPGKVVSVRHTADWRVGPR